MKFVLLKLDPIKEEKIKSKKKMKKLSLKVHRKTTLELRLEVLTTLEFCQERENLLDESHKDTRSRRDVFTD